MSLEQFAGDSAQDIEPPVISSSNKHPSALSSVCVPAFGSCLSPLNLVQALDGYMFLQQGFKCRKNAFRFSAVNIFEHSLDL